jgi:hypothetical protein
MEHTRSSGLAHSHIHRVRNNDDTSIAARCFSMSVVGGAPSSKSQKSLTGFGFSIAGSSKRKQQSSDAHLESEFEVVLDNAVPAVSQLEPLSKAALLKFTVPYECAVYQICRACVLIGSESRSTHFTALLVVMALRI